MKIVVLAAAVLSAGLVGQAQAQNAAQKQRLAEVVTEGFKDPESAKFRNWERVDQVKSAKPGEGMFCGEVNAKNSYGAYTGYVPFIAVLIGTEALLMKVGGDEDDNTIVREICRRSKAGEIGG